MKVSIVAAGNAIGGYADAVNLERPAPPDVLLYHLLFGLMDWCDANGIDFDAAVSEARTEFQSEITGMMEG